MTIYFAIYRKLNLCVPEIKNSIMTDNLDWLNFRFIKMIKKIIATEMGSRDLHKKNGKPHKKVGIPHKKKFNSYSLK